MNNTSSYRKIRQIITAASKGKATISELAENIKGKYDAFVFFQRGNNGKTHPEPTSLSSIRSKIRFCISLGLLISEEDCSLTNQGKKANDDSQFDLVLKNCILKYFEDNGLTWEDIEKQIDLLSLPDSQTLFDNLTPKIPEDKFKTCFFLLSQCGAEKKQNVLKPFQKKVYLTSKKYKTLFG